MKNSCCFAVLTWISITPLVISQEESKIDFERDIAPIFRQNCVACHNAKKAEGGLNLESYDALMAGGDSGAAITVNSLDDSYILPRVTGEEEPWMPPEDNTVGASRLTEEDVELIRKWITAGAADSQPGPQSAITWGTLPENLRPVYAMATSPDGQHLAFGRGNSVTVTALGTSPEADQQTLHMESLIDPSLANSSNSEDTGSAHLDIVQSIAFSPDSQRIATGGYRSIKIWHRKTGAQQVLAGLPPAQAVAAVAPDGNHIAYRTRQLGLVLVDLAAGQSHQFLKAHASPITALVWTEDSGSLISCDAAGNWLRTDVATYQTQPLVLPTNLIATSLMRAAADRLMGINAAGQMFELQFTQDPGSLSAFVRLLEQPLPVTAMTIAGDYSRLAIALSGGRILFQDAASGQLLSEIASGKDVSTLTLNPDCSLLLTVPESGAAQLWKLEDGSLLASLDRDYVMTRQLRFASANISRQKMLVDLLAKELPGLEKAAEKEVEARNKLVEARDKAAEALAATEKERGTADSGLADAQQALAQAEAALAAAKKKVDDMAAQVQAKEKVVAEASQKQLTAKQELSEREQALATASKSVERAQAAIPAFQKRIDTEKNLLSTMESELQSLEEQLQHQPEISSAVFSHDGSQALLASPDRSIRIFSVDGQPQANLTVPADAVTLAALDSNTLTSLTAAGSVLAWDLNFGWELEQSIGNYENSPLSDRVTALDFSPDGTRLAAGSGPPSRFGEIKLFDVESGQVSLDLGEAHSDTVFGLKFSPDGKHLASVAADKLCRLFDVESGNMLRAFEGHTHHVLGVSWHAHGQMLATASADASIKIWKAETGEQVRTIGGFAKEVTSLAFVGPNKPGEPSQIVSASADGIVRLHNADNGKQIKVLSGTGDALYGVVALRDNQEVSAGGQGGKVWTWRLADAKLLGELPPKSR